MNCLEIKDIGYSYQTLAAETPALQNISFTVQEGEFVSIVGPSGCGKSTLLNLICGLIQADSGQILLNGAPIQTTSTHIGYMLQKDHLFEWRTIYSNVTLGLELRHALGEAEKEKVHRMLGTYGLGNFAKSRPSELSGGMRQRAALIRTLATEPDLLLWMNPFPLWIIRPGWRSAMMSGVFYGSSKKQRCWSPMTCQRPSVCLTKLSC